MMCVLTLISLLYVALPSYANKLEHHEDHTSSYNDLFSTLDRNKNDDVSPDEIEEVGECELRVILIPLWPKYVLH